MQDRFPNAQAVRLACRRGEWTKPTAGLAMGYAQANLVILPRTEAEAFREFCRKNPKPCPVLEVTQPGDPVPARFAPDGDLRNDLPKYRIWRYGKMAFEVEDITSIWQFDFVSFLIGCSFTFESALLNAGVPIRHLEENKNVPMYRTNIACEPAGPFHGPMVVSMRPMKPADAIKAVEITSRFPQVHGSPVHLGFPELIGISDLSQPDFGEAVTIHPDELPVFWACGVTPQSVLMAAKIDLAITHAPGCMFVTDVKDEDLKFQGERGV